MSEYDLKKSKKIGQLYPVLVDSKGNVIDGFHRLEADPKWRTEKLAEIDTEEKLLVARCVANWQRRQIPREEKEEWINSLAKIYKKQGLRIQGKRTVIGPITTSNEIIARIVQVTGLSYSTVVQYLNEKFKGRHYEKPPKQPPRTLASELIRQMAETKYRRPEYAQELVERHREEVEQELRPKIEEEVREKIIEEEIKPKVKEELSQDAEFIREAIEKAPEVLPTLPKETIERAKRVVEPKEMVVKEGTVYTVGEYECPHCRKHYLIKCNGKKDWIE